MIANGVTLDTFKNQVLGDKIKLNTSKPSSESIEDGVVIECLPLYKSAALRLKAVVKRYHGDTPIYLRVEGSEPIKVGGMSLTFDTFKALDRVIRMYAPRYSRVQHGNVEVIDASSLVNSAKLPLLNDRDYYM